MPARTAKVLLIIRAAAIILLGAFFLFAHGCHLGDHDEELLTHLWIW